MDPLEARSLIPLTAHYIHMNHAGVSPMTERQRSASGRVLGHDCGHMRALHEAGAAGAEEARRNATSRRVATT